MNNIYLQVKNQSSEYMRKANVDIQLMLRDAPQKYVEYTGGMLESKIVQEYIDIKLKYYQKCVDESIILLKREGASKRIVKKSRKYFENLSNQQQISVKSFLNSNTLFRDISQSNLIKLEALPNEFLDYTQHQYEMLNSRELSYFEKRTLRVSAISLLISLVSLLFSIITKLTIN